MFHVVGVPEYVALCLNLLKRRALKSIATGSIEKVKKRANSIAAKTYSFLHLLHKVAGLADDLVDLEGGGIGLLHGHQGLFAKGRLGC